MKYGDVRLADELQFSVYNFERRTWKRPGSTFELYEAECKSLLEEYSKLIQLSLDLSQKMRSRHSMDRSATSCTHEKSVSAAWRLRPLPEVLASVQHS